MNWHRPDVETSVLDALTKTHGPISARQMVNGIIGKGRAAGAAAAIERRTTWPSAAELQQAADTMRATGVAEDAALAAWLEATANALAWLAPYRPHEGGYEMWGAANAFAQLINGTADATYASTRGEPGDGA